MEKVLSVVMAILMVFSLAACGESDDLGSKRDNNKKTDYTVKNCVMDLVNAETKEDIDKIVTVSSDEYSQQILQMFPDDNYNVSVKKIGSYKGYEAYKCKITNPKDSDFLVDCIEIFKKGGKGYLIENDEEIIQEIVADCQCGTCGGSGSIASSGTACAICAGTGVQYFPNTYFDPATNMWMGETRACSGCAGAGFLGQTSHPCGDCDSLGLIFK